MEGLKGKALTGKYNVTTFRLATFLGCLLATAVAGSTEPAELGVTLPHEHLLLDFTGATQGPGYGSGGCSADELVGLKLEIGNLGKIRQFP